MSEATAHVIFWGILSAGIAVWCLSLVLACRARWSTAREAYNKPVERFDGPTEVGELTVVGSPETISAGLNEAFSSRPTDLVGAKFSVIEHSNQQIMLKKFGAVLCNQPAGLLFSDALFQMAAQGREKVRVSYRLGFAPLARITSTIAFSLIFGIGLPLLLIVGGIVGFLIVPSKDPAVRWQVLQTVHIVHGLWLPFVFLWILSFARHKSRMFVEQLLSEMAVDSAVR